MVSVRAGCRQHLPAGHPFTEVAYTVMGLTRVIHNKFVYHFRQDQFQLEHRRREAYRSGTALPPERSLSFTELKGLVRGTHHQDFLGRVVEDTPNEKIIPLGFLGGIWDRIDYDFKATTRAYWALRKAWHAAGRVGPPPGLPGYHRSEYRSITYRASTLTLSPDKTTVTFVQSRNEGVTPVRLPPLTVPDYVQAALNGGMASLVQVQLQPRRDGSLVLQWALTETGRDGIPFPEAPMTLADALTQGPVVTVDMGVINLLAATTTDFRSAPPGAVLPTPRRTLPGPLLVRGALLERECHQHGARVDAMKSLLPYLPLKGGAGSISNTTIGTSKTTAVVRKGKKPKKTAHRRQQHSSKALQEAWLQHDLRKTHLVYASIQPLLRHLMEVNAKALIVGHNPGIKNKMAMGRKQNRRFGTIPYRAILDALKLACARLGIFYLKIGESYTSRTSFYDGEQPVKHPVYAGRRAKRGLFRTGSGLRVNADVNGSLQILSHALHEHHLESVLTPVVREEIVRANLNPRRVHPDLGARDLPAAPSLPVPSMLAAALAPVALPRVNDAARLVAS